MRNILCYGGGFAKCCLLAALAWCSAAGRAVADESPNQATTSRKAREDAIRSIPFDRLNEQTRTKLAEVVGHPTVFRRLPVQVIDCDPSLFLFLVRYPEVVVNIWKLMGVTQVNVQRTGQYALKTTDGAGTTSKVELVYGDPETHVVFAEGVYEGPLFKRRISGKCVMVLKSGYAQSPEGRNFVTSRLDMFLQVDQLGAELVAKTLRPLLGNAADNNFAESAKFVGKISLASERNGPGIQHLSKRLTQVDPAVRDRFAKLAAAASYRAAMHDTGGDQSHSPGAPTAKPRVGAGENPPNGLPSSSNASPAAGSAAVVGTSQRR